MTYCVAMNLAEGLVMASDTRTNAGVDHIATFCKMTIMEKAGEEVICLMSAGNLATTQSTISLLRRQLQQEQDNLLSQSSMYDVACLVGSTLRDVIERDSKVPMQGSIDFGSSFLLGGQLKGEPPRLFNIYPQGNFIEATEETPYFQIGESKYGKPIIDRVINYNTSLDEAAKCVLISFDSTIRSNISVGMPIDLMCYRRDEFKVSHRVRVGEENAYFQQIRKGWSHGLRETFSRLPDMSWSE